MIAGFLRNNHLGAILLIPILALLLWLPTLLHTQLHPVFHGMPLFVLVDKYVSAVPYLNSVVAVVLIIAEALLLNFIVVQHLVAPRDNYLTAGLYVLLMSSSKSFLTLHPILFANLFLMLSLRSVFMMHRKETAFGNAFDAGLLISIASLFYLPALFFFPLLAFSFLLMRPFIWREWVISLMGLIVPYLFVALYYFWIGDLLYLWNNRLPFTFEGKISATALPSSNYFFLITGGILTVFAVMNLFNSVAALSLKARSTSYIMFWFMLFAAVILIASPKYKAPYTGLVFIPLSVFLANYLLQVKKNWWRELCFTALLAAVIYNIMLR
jgi:hypothetical protein